MADDHRKQMDDELSSLITKNKNALEKDTYSQISQDQFSSSKILDYNIPIGICPKAELDDDCK